MAEEHISKNRHNFRDLTDQRFGQLIAISLNPERAKGGQARWNCICDCGNPKVVQSSNLCNLTTTSCGHFRRDRAAALNKTHGQWQTRAFSAWVAARKRCFNPRYQSFKDYGARGITMCERWRNDFSEFLRDMGPCPDGLTLERINNNGNYEPGNCEWASYTDQGRNRRNTIRITHEGRTLTLMEWSEITGVSPSLIRQRYYKKLPLFVPSRKRPPSGKDHK